MDKKLALTAFIIIVFAGAVIAGSGRYAMFFKNSAGNRVARILDNGVADFKDSCAYGGTCSWTSGKCTKILNCSNPEPKSFVVRNMSNDIVAWINSTGGICCSGDIKQNVLNLQVEGYSYTRERFVRFKDASGTDIGLISSRGDCEFIGAIRCNSLETLQ